MKKLLILGANPETIPLIETAKKMGLYTIVTDPDPEAPAKKVADRGININGMDITSLVQFCKTEKVDGVLVGVADRLIEPYQKVCEMLQLPSYGNQYQCEVLTNKEKFNKVCGEYQLLVIPSVSLPKRYNSADLENITYPVFIKPVDRNSGKGMSIAYTRRELEQGIEKAFNTTSSDSILLEKYMTCNDILVSFTVVDGEPTLSAMADRYTCKEQSKTSQVCLGAVYPSELLSLYMDKEYPKMVKMLKGIGLQNAILTVSAFVEDGHFYYYDPGFRLQGEAPNLHMENINKFDQKKFLVDIALGNKFDKSQNITQASFEGNYAATVWLLLKEGIISSIQGFDKIETDPTIFHVSRRLFEGDTVSREMVGTEAQVMARLYLKCKTKEELRNKLSEVYNTVKVLDRANNNQLINGFKYE
jgi:biotin carboxylase